MVSDAPTFGDLYGFLSKMLSNEVVVTHTSFDKSALRQASELISFPDFDCRWLDSARVTRRTWSELSKSGYGLANTCKLIGYEFEHHHALEDAKAAGQIVIASMTKLGMSLEELLHRVERPIQPGSAKVSQESIKRDGNPDGPLFGETVVFTGALMMPRREAANLAAEMGCCVNTAVTKDTTLLIVGDSEGKRSVDTKLTSKHRRAIELQRAGFDLRIIGETDFNRLVRTS